MGLETMSLLASASVAASGGTALAFAKDSVAIQGGIHLIVPSDADYQTRRSVTAKVKPASINVKTGVYTKDKKSMSLTRPKVLTDGSVVFEVFRVEREMHPSSPAADALEMNSLGAQMIIDSDAAGFWANGTL
jgi:hypothetical protein